MKTFKGLFSTIFTGSFLFISILLTGCSTISGGTPFNMAQQDAIITSVTTLGAEGAMLANPSYRPAFQAAVPVLELLSQTNQLSVADINTALTTLKVNGASTPIVAQSISQTLNLLNAFGVGVQSLPMTNQLAAMQGVTMAIHDGLTNALWIPGTSSP